MVEELTKLTKAELMDNLVRTHAALEQTITVLVTASVILPAAYSELIFNQNSKTFVCSFAPRFVTSPVTATRAGLLQPG